MGGRSPPPARAAISRNGAALGCANPRPARSSPDRLPELPWPASRSARTGGRSPSPARPTTASPDRSCSGTCAPIPGSADFVSAHQGSLTSVAFSPDGRTLAAASYADNDNTNGSLLLWDVRTRRPLGTPFGGHHGIVTDVAFSPDGRMVASATDDGATRLWDTRTHAELGRSPARDRGADQRHRVQPGRTHARRCREARNRVALGRRKRASASDARSTGQQGSVSGVAFSRDGRELASAGRDGTVRLWKLSGRRGVRRAAARPRG